MSGYAIRREALQILQTLNNSSVFASFVVNPSFLEIYNMKYTEKQVRRIDENFLDYSSFLTLRLAVPSPRLRRYGLVYKYFSGDVSGDIGEALVVYFLVEELGLKSYNICHLRSEKRRRYLTPDFIIWDQNNALTRMIQESHHPMVYAEVKSSTRVMTDERIERGLNQLKRVIGSRHGLLFLVQKNQDKRGYVVHVVVVKE